MERFEYLSSEIQIEILKLYTKPNDILSANKDDLISILLKPKKGIAYAEDKYYKLINTAKSANII
ncbi:hypothetical protein [Asaccharospora irregularis]|uniref:hypothetical protein n=1 Tax=Asaccharospora irregularis TaxID=29359 RepID=UPI0031D43D24